jgi:hypothetical protein
MLTFSGSIIFPAFSILFSGGNCLKEWTDMYSRCKAISYYMGLIDRFEECWTHKSVQSSDEERPVAREWVLYDGSDEDKPTEIGWTAYEMIC